MTSLIIDRTKLLGFRLASSAATDAKVGGKGIIGPSPRFP